jgi:hypothetical protein
MAAPPEPACRLYVIQARDGRSAVVFRRGPTQQVLVLRWWLGSDKIEPGQWLKGRIYERRCDLSPDGDLLIYFAAKWNTPMQTWTAVSRTPYLTALALWSKGDAWGGGGVFMAPKAIGLNHREVGPAQSGTEKSSSVRWHPLGPETEEAPDNPVPKRFKVQRWSEYAGGGEDNPILHHRATRDGWTLVDAGDAGPHSQGSYGWLFNRPEIYERVAPGQALVLRRYLRAIYQKNGPWYVEDFEVRKSDGTVRRLIEACSWADWQANGDLLFALGDSLYRLPGNHAAELASDPLNNAKCVASLGELRFDGIIAPDWARQWP